VPFTSASPTRRKRRGMPEDTRLIPMCPYAGDKKLPPCSRSEVIPFHQKPHNSLQPVAPLLRLGGMPPILEKNNCETVSVPPSAGLPFAGEGMWRHSYRFDCNLV
jgi:hypothetical protein